MKTFPRTSSAALWLLLSILSAGSMAYFVAKIWSTNQPPGFSDLYAGWWGAHELLLHDRTPYQPAIAHEIQTVIYGAPVAPGSAQDPSGIAGGFAYPPYVAFLLWPTVYLSFAAAQRVFLAVSVAGTLFSVAAWLRLLRFRWSPLMWITVATFTLGSFPAMQGLKLQNPSLLAASFIAIALFLLSTDRLVSAGMLLAISTFKPQFMIALIPWLALWTVSAWRRRRPFAWSFLATLLALVLTSEWFVPGWISSFLSVIRAYRKYTYGHSLLDVWFTPTVGSWIGACLLIATFVCCWKYRWEPAGSARFVLVIALLLAMTLVVIPTLASHAQLLLLPGFLTLLRQRAELAFIGVLGRLVSAAAWALLGWPWIVAFALMLAAIRFPTSALLRFWEIPLYTSPLLPLGIALALGCRRYSACGASDPVSPSPS